MVGALPPLCLACWPAAVMCRLAGHCRQSTPMAPPQSAPGAMPSPLPCLNSCTFCPHPHAHPAAAARQPATFNLCPPIPLASSPASACAGNPGQQPAALPAAACKIPWAGPQRVRGTFAGGALCRGRPTGGCARVGMWCAYDCVYLMCPVCFGKPALR